MDGIREWLQRGVEFASAWTAVVCVWLAETVMALGYIGILVLMAVESSLVPFPSELVMPPAGFLIHDGQMAWAPVLLAGTAGSLAGALVNYYLARWLGRPFLLRYGQYMFLKPEALAKAEVFFATHGEIATFVGRLIPVIRQLISLPAGLAGMNIGRFCLFTTLGAGIWVTILTWIGWMVAKNRDLVQIYLRQATLWVGLFTCALVLVYYKIYRLRHPRPQEEPPWNPEGAGDD